MVGGIVFMGGVSWPAAAAPCPSPSPARGYPYMDALPTLVPRSQGRGSLQEVGCAGEGDYVAWPLSDVVGISGVGGSRRAMISWQRCWAGGRWGLRLQSEAAPRDGPGKDGGDGFFCVEPGKRRR